MLTRGFGGNPRATPADVEKWFSTPIGLLLRSVNSDPRFGETEGAKSPALFQVPAKR